MTTIRIGAFDYTLTFVLRLQDDDGEACDGLQKYNATSIELEAEQSLSAQHIALWHEICHAILDNAGIRQKLQKENVIDAIAHGIAQVLRDNPWLMTPETLAEMTKNKSLDNP